MANSPNLSQTIQITNTACMKYIAISPKVVYYLPISQLTRQYTIFFLIHLPLLTTIVAFQEQLMNGIIYTIPIHLIEIVNTDI